MLRDLTENEISEFLRFVAEVKDASVFADDTDALLSDVDHQLRPQDRVVAGCNYADLKMKKKIYFALVICTEYNEYFADLI